MTRIVYLIVCIIGTSVADVLAQYSTKGLDLDGDIASWYDRAAGINHKKIFEGSFYQLGSLHLAENQYFKSGKWATGIVCFDGQEYQELDLLYNSFKDELIIRNPTLHFSIAQPMLVNQQRVDYFQLHDRLFVHFKDTISSPRGPGFYEKMLDGKSISFFAKRIKNEYIRSGKLIYEVEDRYYLFYNGEYTRYKSKQTIYRMFAKQRAQVKNYGKQLDTRLRRGGEKNLLQLLKYCDQLLSKE